MDKYSIAMIFVNSFWFLSEILINLLTRSKKTEAKSHDQNSLGKIWIVIALSITAGVYIAFAYPKFGTTKYFSGISLMIIGIILRLFTVFSLKSLFTADVAIHQNHKLKTDGIFKIVRHPSYSGSLLTFLGFGLTLGNWISLLVVFLPVLGVFSYRINIEEKALKDNFKDEYTEYQKRTKKLIPFIY
ncbi:MAG: isoprenylcysteine carboxylmethyltransferase family protein [Mariniphaga sp.]